MTRMNTANDSSPWQIIDVLKILYTQFFETSCSWQGMDVKFDKFTKPVEYFLFLNRFTIPRGFSKFSVIQSNHLFLHSLQAVGPQTTRSHREGLHVTCEAWPWGAFFPLFPLRQRSSTKNATYRQWESIANRISSDALQLSHLSSQSTYSLIGRDAPAQRMT